MKPLGKYVKPDSLTWWVGGVVPIASGLLLALAPQIEALRPAAEVVRSLYPAGTTAAILINGGLVVIGLRGAPGMNRGAAE